MPTADRAARLAELLDTRASVRPALAETIASHLANDPAFAIHQAPPPGLLRQLEARRHHDTADRISNLRVPTLVAAGRFDGIAPLATCKALADAIPDSQLAVLDGGHGRGLLMQDPAAWPLIASFLSEPA